MNIKFLKDILWQFCISRDFRKKLNRNFSDLTMVEKFVYLIFIKPFFKNRFFFEGNIRIPGQVNTEERRAMYTLIIERKMKNFFEIGTWKGGGSTFYAAMAFKQLGQGRVYTSENNQKIYEQAIHSYNRFAPDLKPFINFLLTQNLNDFLPFLQKEQIADCVFLDGSDIPHETVSQWKFFSNFMICGSLLFLHDWNSQKMSALRPLLLSSNEWQLILELGEPVSNGFAIFKKN